MKVQDHIFWKERRRIVLETKGVKCFKCGTVSNIQVHHNCYQVGRAYWDYGDEYLDVVCERCHGIIHNGISNDRLYKLGSNIPVEHTVVGLSPLVERIRRLMIRKLYTIEMGLNVYAGKKKKVSWKDYMGLLYISGVDDELLRKLLTDRKLEIQKK